MEGCGEGAVAHVRLVLGGSRAYDRHIDAVRVLWDVLTTARTEGLDEGRAEGLEEGKAEEKYAIARGMKADEMPVEAIAKYTGLSVEEIEKL